MDLPTIILTAGAMLPLPHPEENRTVVTSDLKEAIGLRHQGQIDAATLWP